MADWEKIKLDYITQPDMSYRKLAELYGLNETTIARRAGAEHWVQLRQEQASKVLSKTTDKIAKKRADKYARIDDLADQLLEKLEQAVGELDLSITQVTSRKGDKNNYTETKRLKASPGGTVDQKALRNLTAALKDLKEVKDIKCKLDRQEQQARIDNLRKQAKDDKDKIQDVKVELEGLSDYAD